MDVEPFSLQLEPRTPAPPVPWTVRDIWIGLAALLGWMGLSLGITALLGFLRVPLDASILVTLVQAVLLLPVWWLTVRKYRVGWATLGLRRFHWAMLIVGGVLMLVSFSFNLVYSLILLLFDLRMQADMTPLLESTAYPWLFFLGAAVVAPLTEELFFRGFVFAGLRERYGWVKAMLISAGLFALIHFQPAALPAIFLLGCIFAYLYHRSRSLWPAILMHMATNALAVGATYLLSRLDTLPAG